MSGLSNIVVVLVEPESPGNVGFTARAMANFGVTTLRIVRCDPRTDDEAVMFSVHARDVLEGAEIHPSLKSAISDTHAAWAATARAGGNHSVTRALVRLGELPNPTALDGRIALVFGRESSGLTNEEISQCDLAFTIPVSERYSSMNLSHAVAVVLYDLFLRYSESAGIPRARQRPAERWEKQQACKFFDEIIDEVPIKDFRRPIAKQVFRNLVGRAFMTGREITTLIGTIRKIRDYVKRCTGEPQSTP
ncbi:MAG: RNA methyltransferase [Candidatus Thorarchaeota archaeon]|nr:MAG: RNA methyltransferase [Candidatus Thorarchaeota archaeon]